MTAPPDKQDTASVYATWLRGRWLRRYSDDDDLLTLKCTLRDTFMAIAVVRGLVGLPMSMRSAIEYLSLPWLGSLFLSCLSLDPGSAFDLSP